MSNDGKLGAVSAERRIIALLFANPDLCERVSERLLPDDFVSSETGEIYRRLIEATACSEFLGMASISSLLTDVQTAMLSGILAETAGVNFAVEDADLYIDKILKTKNEPAKEEIKTMDAEALKDLINKNKK